MTRVRAAILFALTFGHGALAADHGLASPGTTVQRFVDACGALGSFSAATKNAQANGWSPLKAEVRDPVRDYLSVTGARTSNDGRKMIFSRPNSFKNLRLVISETPQANSVRRKCEVWDLSAQSTPSLAALNVLGNVEPDGAGGYNLWQPSAFKGHHMGRVTFLDRQKMQFILSNSGHSERRAQPFSAAVFSTSVSGKE